MSARPRILVTQRIHEEVQQRLAVHGDLDMNPGPDPWPQSEVIRRAAQSTALMGFMTDQIDGALLTAAPHLKIVACALKGYDNYDVPACTQAGVWVDCFRARAPIVHNHYAALEYRKGLPPGHAAILRELTVPVLRDGNVVAIAGVGNKPVLYTEGDAQAFQKLASLTMYLVESLRAK